MAKFSGPAHVTSISLSSGPVAVVDGIVEVHEPTQGDVSGLAANGFSLIAEGAYFALPAVEPVAEQEPAPQIEAPAPEPEPEPAAAEPASEAEHPAE